MKLSTAGKIIIPVSLLVCVEFMRAHIHPGGWGSVYNTWPGGERSDRYGVQSPELNDPVRGRAIRR